MDSIARPTSPLVRRPDPPVTIVYIPLAYRQQQRQTTPRPRWPVEVRQTLLLWLAAVLLFVATYALLTWLGYAPTPPVLPASGGLA